MDGVLIGKGNTYIEKAYQAAVGKSLARAESAAALQEGGDLIRIYDAGTAGTETQEAGVKRSFCHQNPWYLPAARMHPALWRECC